MECSIQSTGEDDAECCAVVGDNCSHTNDCQWYVTSYGDDHEMRWCDTHHREFDLLTA